MLISDQNGRALNDLLEKEKGELVDLVVLLGEEKYEARLTAIRASQAVAEKNLREAHERAAAQSKTLSKAQRIRCQWHIVVSNIPREILSAKQVAELYRCRWNIEIIFRAWKQSANLGKALNRKSNEDHFQALMLAGMIYQVMSLSMLTLMRAVIPKAKRVSYENSLMISVNGSLNVKLWMRFGILTQTHVTSLRRVAKTAAPLKILGSSS